MKKRKWIIWLVVMPILIIGILIGYFTVKNNADMEYAAALVRVSFGSEYNLDSDIIEIQISNVYEQSHPKSLEDAARALIASMKILEASDSQEAIDMANKLVELNRYTGEEYDDMSYPVRQFAIDYDISNAEALDTILKEATE
jgi:hypothetical protein